MDEVAAQSASTREDTQSQKRKYEVMDSRLDYEQVQKRWHRDPWGRQDTQSVAKRVENQRNLEEAMYNGGFSQVRASKIAHYMTRCDGQFQEWDFIVKTQPRLKNRITQKEDDVSSTTEIVQGQLDLAVDEDGEEGETNDEDSDRDGSEIPSVVEGGRRRLQELKASVGGGHSPAKAARKPRSYKDERQRRKDRKSEAARIKEYASYTYDDYVQAARRYDIVYGSAEKLYQLAEDKKAALLVQAQRMYKQPTTEMIVQGKFVDVEDPTFGITQPSAEEALTQEERRARDQSNKQLWAERQRETLIWS